MKILHISPSYYPAFKYGGPIQSVHLLNKFLVKKGVKVDVLTTNAGIGEDENIRLNDWIIIDECRIKYLNYYGYEHYNFSIQFIFELKKIIVNYDLVHITAVWNFPVLVGSYFCRIYKIPYIISPRGTIYPETMNMGLSLFKRIYFLLIARHYLNRTAALHFTSEDERKKVMDSYNLKSDAFVIANGLDLTEVKKDYPRKLIESFGIHKKMKYLLVLGRLDKKKGFDILIPAVKEIISQREDLYLVIAGNSQTSYLNVIKQMILDNSIKNKVIFTDEVSGDVKWALYYFAEIFVLPSYSENFGMVVVEAMACGTPVVISNKVGIHKEVEQNEAGIIVEANSERVKYGINKLLNNDYTRLMVSKKGKELVEMLYDIDKVVILMIDTFNKIINKHNSTFRI